MNRILRSATLTLMLLVAFAASAQKSLTLGYCNNEISASDYRESLSAQVQLMGAIRIPAARLAALKDKHAKLTKIRLGAEAGMTNTYLWVRPSLEGSTLALQRLGTTADGWNEITLANPYEVTGEDIYIGFNATLPKGISIILNGVSTPNGANVAVSGTWKDLSPAGLGSLCIQGVVESDEDLPTNDMAIEDVTMDATYAPLGSTRQFTATVANYGTQAKPLPRCYYQLGDGAAHEISTLTNAVLQPNGYQTLSFSAKIEDLPEGVADLKVWIESDDDAQENNTFTKQIFTYATAFPHKMLLEQFTTLQCVNCPYGLRVLDALTAGHDDVVWVAHHTGYGSDQFTIQASNDLYYYGITSAPRAMFDRSMLSVSENSRPAFGIGYTQVSGGLQALGEPFNEVLSRPAFVSVGIESDYDESSRQLALKVSGERNGLFSKLYGEARLTVYLVEDSCVSRRQQSGGTPADTIHNHVVREALTASLGDVVTWNGDRYEQEFTTTLPDTWKPEHLKVVAFIHRPTTDGYSHCEVLNTESLNVATQTTAIGGVHADDDANAPRRYFNLQGQQLSGVPSQGVYIEQIVTASGVKSRKHVTR